MIVTKHVCIDFRENMSLSVGRSVARSLEKNCESTWLLAHGLLKDD